MSWQEGVAVALVCLGLLAGAYIAAQRPAFWLELATRLGRALLPRLLAFVMRRMTPAEEAEWRQAVRQGRGDEWLRGRARRRRKGA